MNKSEMGKTLGQPAPRTKKRTQPAKRSNDQMTRLISIDPGDVHQGITFANLDPTAPQGGQLVVRWQTEWRRNQLVEELESYQGSQVHRLDLILLEEYRLYPWMARQQGFSNFETCEVIGVVKYLADLLDVPVIMTRPDELKSAVAVARANQPGLIRHYPKRKDGVWYFVGRNEHERDSLGHAVWFAWRNRHSPLYRPPGREVA